MTRGGWMDKKSDGLTFDNEMDIWMDEYKNKANTYKSRARLRE